MKKMALLHRWIFNSKTKIVDNKKKRMIDCIGVILCHLPEKGRKEIEHMVEEMKERDKEERGPGMKVKIQKK